MKKKLIWNKEEFGKKILKDFMKKKKKLLELLKK